MSNTIRYGYTNSLQRNVTGMTVATLLADPNLKAALGFGDNVTAKVNGVRVDSSYVIKSGENIDIETKANEKANDVNITLRFGLTNVLQRRVPANTTIKAVLTNANYRAVLGFGDNVVAKINGASVRDDLFVTDGLVIDIEQKANEKANA